MTRNQFRCMVARVAAEPTESNLQAITDDLGYIQILVKLANASTFMSAFNDSEPLFKPGGWINWPPPKGD